MRSLLCVFLTALVLLMLVVADASAFHPKQIPFAGPMIGSFMGGRGGPGFNPQKMIGPFMGGHGPGRYPPGFPHPHSGFHPPRHPPPPAHHPRTAYACPGTYGPVVYCRCCCCQRPPGHWYAPHHPMMPYAQHPGGYDPKPGYGGYRGHPLSYLEGEEGNRYMAALHSYLETQEGKVTTGPTVNLMQLATHHAEKKLTVDPTEMVVHLGPSKKLDAAEPKPIEERKTIVLQANLKATVRDLELQSGLPRQKRTETTPIAPGGPSGGALPTTTPSAPATAPQLPRTIRVIDPTKGEPTAVPRSKY